MTSIFVSHAPEDAPCAETIRHGLELQGYTCWQEPGYPGPADHSYPHMIASAILGSAALILVWDTDAAQAAWVARHIQIALQLKKKILPIVMDTTPLPPLLAVSTPVLSHVTSCDEVVSQLLPHLPAHDNQDRLLVLSEKAAHEFISNRRAAIELATDMLARDEHREEVLALLTFLAQNDLLPGVRERAQEALDAAQQKTAPVLPVPFLNAADARYMLGVRCGKCSHITSFDRRRLCSENRIIKRTASSAPANDLDEMELPCQQCGHMMVKQVDCEGL